MKQNFSEATTAKAVQVRSDFTAYVTDKTRFSAVFITLLHCRVAEVPRKWSGKTALSTWQHHLGVCHNELGRIFSPHGFELHLYTSLACIAPLNSKDQSWTSHMSGIKNDITGRYKHTGVAQWIILISVCRSAPCFQEDQKKWGP